MSKLTEADIEIRLLALEAAANQLDARLVSLESRQQAEQSCREHIPIGPGPDDYGEINTRGCEPDMTEETKAALAEVAKEVKEYLNKQPETPSENAKRIAGQICAAPASGQEASVADAARLCRETEAMLDKRDAHIQQLESQLAKERERAEKAEKERDAANVQSKLAENHIKWWKEQAESKSQPVACDVDAIIPILRKESPTRWADIIRQHIKPLDRARVLEVVTSMFSRSRWSNAEPFVNTLWAELGLAGE